MSLYERRILPWMIERVMAQKALAKERSRMIPQARGRVLEVGIGSGLNLAHYAADVDFVVGIDPSEGLQERARERSRTLPFPVEHVTGSAESMPFEAKSFDTVVSTWTLCSIPKVEQALAEARRVLRPGGALLFVEHGRAPDPRVAKTQDRINRVWPHVAGGCNLNRPMASLIQGAGFEVVDRRYSYGAGPRVLSYMYRGAARPR